MTAKALLLFQSTLPVGEATLNLYVALHFQHISIHASRGGSDTMSSAVSAIFTDFNPRFPWGKRPGGGGPGNPTERFQSTLPVGEATAFVNRFLGLIEISIHASRGGSDNIFLACREKPDIFQSTLPVGEATVDVSYRIQNVEISIHASRGGSDYVAFGIFGKLSNFNPRFPWGKRRNQGAGTDGKGDFNPRFPWGKRRLQLSAAL